MFNFFLLFIHLFHTSPIYWYVIFINPKGTGRGTMRAWNLACALLTKLFPVGFWPLMGTNLSNSSALRGGPFKFFLLRGLCPEVLCLGLAINQICGLTLKWAWKVEMLDIPFLLFIQCWINPDRPILIQLLFIQYSLSIIKHFSHPRSSLILIGCR